MVGKKELIDRIAEKGFTKKDTDAFLNALSEVVLDALEEGETVKIGQIVTIGVKEVSEKEARNPKTNETVIVEAHRKPTVKVSQTVKDRIW